MYKGIQIVSKKELKKEETKDKKKAAHKREHIHAEGSKEPVHTEKHTAMEKSEKKSQGLLGRMVTGRAKARSGMGGGTGTGAAPVVAQATRETGAISIAVVTMPFECEKARIEKAEFGLQELRDVVDTVIVTRTAHTICCCIERRIERIEP